MDDRQARQAVEFYREYFAVRGLFENAVFPGIVELLQELQMQGTRLMVATSKPTTFALRILDHFQLSPYFEYIAGSELDGSRVKKSEVIAHVLTERSLYDKTEIVMIGDREFDIVGAQKNGLDSIAVKYGYGTAQELESARPTYIVETVQELADLLAERELVS